VIGMVTSTTDFAYAISAMSIREFLRGARGGEIVLSNLEKWQGANWRKEYEARLNLKEVAMVTKPVVEVVELATTKTEEKLPEGIIIAFAAAPGGLARAEQKHGIYTKYFLQEIQKSQQIEELFQQVSRSVRETTGGEQAPWYNAALSSGSFCLEGCLKMSLSPIKKLALVIGNTHYSVKPLESAINDAQSVAKILGEKGFNVVLETDVDFSEMDKIIQTFVKSLSAENGVGLFYFAGSGVQIDGKDYLIPVNYKSYSNQDEMIRSLVTTRSLILVNKIVNDMQSANKKLNIVILDSSRSEWQPTVESTKSTNAGANASALEKFMLQLKGGNYIIIAGSHNSEGKAKREARSIKAKYPELFYPQKNNDLSKKYGEEGIYFDGKLWVVYIGGFYLQESAKSLLKKVTKELNLPREPFIYHWTRELPFTNF